jgi:hypothetical protein
VKRGGIYIRVKAHDRVKEGGVFNAVAPWCGRGAARDEAVALLARCGRKEMRWGGGGRTGPVGWLGLPGRSGPKGRVGWLATGPIGPKVEEDFFSDKN